jgi:hypothetical protein
MDYQITVSNARDTDSELRSLTDWLRDEEGLRAPSVRRAARPPAPGEMGAISDILLVALGSGGAVTVMAASIETWLKQRSSDVTVTVKRGQREITVDVRRARNPGELLREIKRLGLDSLD